MTDRDATHTYTVPDDPKMLRETLSAAQAALLHSDFAMDTREHVERLQRLIDDCERKRPPLPPPNPLLGQTPDDVPARSLVGLPAGTTTERRIEWCDVTWNPVTGCTKVSPGCDHCYAETIANRFAGSQAFPNGFDVTLHPDRLRKPFAWRKPRRVFVNSMSDLFHDSVPDECIARVFAVMAATPRHTYQILTKRHARMRALLSDGLWWNYVTAYTAAKTGVPLDYQSPPPNVWLGVSVENQKWADIRIPALLETPAAVRFLSCEPLLGPVNLDGTAIGWWARFPDEPADGSHGGGIDWVICGAESGPGARPMDEQWARDLVTQCRAAGVATFVKQLGSVWARKHGSTSSKGGNPEEWPEDLRVREFPTARLEVP